MICTRIHLTDGNSLVVDEEVLSERLRQGFIRVDRDRSSFLIPTHSILMLEWFERPGF